MRWRDACVHAGTLALEGAKPGPFQASRQNYLVIQLVRGATFGYLQRSFIG